MPELVDHYWEGDEDGHNCAECQDRDDALHLCWPQSHPCFLCMTVPLAWPDTACQPCRLDADARSDKVSDPIERLLSEHAHMEPLCSEDFTMCRCALSFTGGPAYHRRHVAELIYDALGGEPVPWEIGPNSESRAKFGDDNRIIPDPALTQNACYDADDADQPRDIGPQEEI